MFTDTVSSAIDKATKFLSSSSPTARLDADILLAFVLKKDRSWLITHRAFPLTKDKIENYKKLILRRKAYEPVAYIINKKEFMGLDFYVDNDVLIPRPDTEILVEKAIEIIEKENIKSVLEIGTGSGAIACSVAYYSKNSLRLEALDISDKSIEIAKKNASTIGVATNIKFFKADIFNFTPKKRYDLILVNPPYLKDSEITNEHLYEPFQALWGGESGLNFISLLLPKLSLLTDKTALMEIGKDQDKAVVNSNLFQIKFIKDLSGINRVAILRKPAK